MIEKTIERAREMYRVFKCMIKGAKACVLDLTVFLFFPPFTAFTCFCLAVNWVVEGSQENPMA